MDPYGRMLHSDVQVKEQSWAHVVQDVAMAVSASAKHITRTENVNRKQKKGMR